MKRTMRIATSGVVAVMVLAVGLASPIAGSVPNVAAEANAYDGDQFFPMAIGNTWQWADAQRVETVKHLTIVDKTNVEGYTVWVAETEDCVEGISQTPGVMYFVAHEDGLFATRFLDTLMDWAHDTDNTAMLQCWTQRKVAVGTYTFHRGGTAQAYTVGIEDGVPAMRIHDASGQTTYQHYAYGIGPVVRSGHFELERATVGGVEYTL